MGDFSSQTWKATRTNNGSFNFVAPQTSTNNTDHQGFIMRRRQTQRTRHHRRNGHHELLEARHLLAGDLIGHWVADDLNDAVAADGIITTWTDNQGGIEASASGTPTLVRDAIGGRSAVRFQPGDGVDGLRVRAADNPMTALSEFSIVATFITDSQSLAGTDGSWFANTGLVDSNAAGFSSDWGLTINAAGKIAAGTGGGFLNPATTVYSETSSLNDNQLHTVAMTLSGTDLTVHVDDAAPVSRADANGGTRAPLDITFGMLQTSALPFEGDITQIRFYDGALTADEFGAVREEISSFYSNAAPVSVDDAYETTEDNVFFAVTAANGVLANDSDLDGDALTAVVIEGPQHGELAFSSDGSFLYSPSNNFFGVDTFTYAANDFRNGNSATVTINVTPVYDPPAAVADTYEITPGEEAVIPGLIGLLTNDSNPDNVPLTASLVDDVSAGELTLSADGGFRYSPGGFLGTTTFRYRVSDGTTDSAPATVTLIVNSAPLTEDDSYELDEDTVLTVGADAGILANDVDQEGDDVTLELLSETTHGELTIEQNGSFTYTPSAEYSGTDQFTYLLDDGRDRSEPATVTLTVKSVNDAPVARGDSYITSPQEVLEINADGGLLSNDSDLDNDELTVVIITQPTSGALTANPDGSFTYTSADGFSGLDSFSYQADDGTVRSEIATVSIISDVAAGRTTDPTGDSVVTFSEIMYNPVAADEGGEWIELHNQMGINMDISGWRLDGGVEFDFVEGTVIPGNEYLVIAADPEAFTKATGISALGPFTGRLANDGEELHLINNSDRFLDILDYRDGGNWPVGADGTGATLAKRYLHVATGPSENWVASREIGGTPGSVNFPAATFNVVSDTAISWGDEWQFNAAGNDLGNDWTSLNYDASQWQTGSGIFEAGSPVFPPADAAKLIDPGVDLIGYWPLDETGGDVTANLAPGGTDGEIKRSARFTNDPTRGQVLNLDGRNDHVICGELPAIGVNDDFTWSVWVNLDNISANALILGNRTGGTAAPLQFTKLTPTKFEFYNDGGDPFLYHNLSTDRWTHIAVVKSGPTLTYYANGESIASAETTQDMDANPFYIGGDPGVREYLDGQVDDVAVWSRALPEKTVAGLFDGTYTPLTAPTARTDGPIIPDDLPDTRTEIPADSTTVYFRKEFNFSGQLADDTQATLRHLLDDGMAVYLNGQEVYRQNLPAGPLTAATEATSEITSIGATGPVELNVDALRQGTNVLAVEVHQNNGETRDMFFASELITHAVPIDPNSTPLPVINEMSAAEDAEFQVELFNPTSATIDLAGYALQSSNGERAATSLGGATLSPGSYLTVTADQLGYRPADGERLSLTYLDGTMLADTQTVDDRLRGRSAEHEGRWLFPSAATFGSENSFNVESNIVINEIQYHAPGFYVESLDRLFGNSEQWVEIYNRSQDTTVDLSGWEFTEGFDFVFPEGTKLEPQQYLVISDSPEALVASRPGLDAARVLGPFDQNLSNQGEMLELSDSNGNPTDWVRYYDGGRWGSEADGSASTLELRDPFSDNNVAEAWDASDETDQHTWQTITYRGSGRPGSGEPSTYNELIFGLLDGGQMLIDDVRVVENPGTPDAVQLIQNGTFEGDELGQGPAHWRIIGTHAGTVVVDPEDPNNKVLLMDASGPTEHMHNHAETTLKEGDEVHRINRSSEYEVSFRAKWQSGSNQLNSRLYFGRAARVTRVDRPVNVGTPGEKNSQAEENIGPTYQGMVHSPAVPNANQPVNVSVAASDPQGISELQVWYSVDGGDFASTPMTLGEDGEYVGVIPGQDAATLVHFYIEGRDASGISSMYPAAGPDARALYRVQDGSAMEDQRHNLRILMTEEDTNRLHETTNVMSNHRIGTTVIYRESEVFYDVGVRLKGSQRGRDKVVRAGFNLGFDPSELFRGVHSTIGVDRSGSGDEYSQEEIIVRQVFNHAGNMPQIYDDLINVIAPQSRHSGSAMLNMARYNDVFLDSQFENGSQGTAYEYELIYYPTSQVGGIEGLKRPNPDSVVGVSMNDQGDDKERYRWHWLIENNRKMDDYSNLIVALKQIGKRDSVPNFQEDLMAVVDVDQWLRSFAALSLTGIGDNYGSGSQHNGIFYVRPSDGKLLLLPWDMDFSFTNGATAPPVNNNELRKMLKHPGHEHNYYGHLHDIITTTFNAEYMNGWIDHFDQLVPSQPHFQSFKNYINTRSNAVTRSIERAIDVVPFEITTPSPLDAGAATTVQLAGTGWVDVREIRLAGEDAALPLVWTTPNEWQVEIPALNGTNDVALEAYDFQGNLVTSDSISITSALSTPVRDNLRVSEVHYHPADPTAGEPDLDDNAFEFIEVTNIGNEPLDLAGVSFIQVEIDGDQEGIEFTFDAQTLAAGGFLVVPTNREAFTARYGNAVPLASGQGDANSPGEYAGRLGNGGETITLVDDTGFIVQQFTYDDAWHESTDGSGPSLEMIDPTQSDLGAWNQAASWRPSATPGGTPGGEGRVPGDSNMDGVFDSSDFVFVLQIGEYEDGIDGNSTFSEGDWNGDGDFDSGDFVFVFQAGTYVTGEGNQAAAIAAAIHADRSTDSRLSEERIVRNRIDSSRPVPKLQHDSATTLAVDNLFEQDEEFSTWNDDVDLDDLVDEDSLDLTTDFLDL